jgi:hypothetical protein
VVGYKKLGFGPMQETKFDLCFNPQNLIPFSGNQQKAWRQVEN